MKQVICRNLNELNSSAKKILSLCDNAKIAFYGNLGAGKTTLIREICKLLGADALVSSPTYTILNEYQGDHIIYHFDFYRLKKAEEIYELGYEEYFFSDDYVFIEWPEKIEDMLPDFFAKISIETGEEDERIFTLIS